VTGRTTANIILTGKLLIITIAVIYAQVYLSSDFAVDQTITYRFVMSFAVSHCISDIQLDEISNFGRNNARPETSREGESLLIWYYILYIYIVHNVIYNANYIENAKHGKYEIYLIVTL